MRYHNITKDDMLNGEGLRVVLWTAGCPHKCPGCHNPVTWDENGGLPFGEAERQEIFDELSHSYISGITFSGGDPLHKTNIDGVTELAKEIRAKFPDKTIWLYTGFEWEQICNLPVVKYLDVIIDGRFVKEKLDNKLHWRGSSNQRVIDVKASLKRGSAVLYDNK